MSTRTPLSLALFALLAGVPAARLLAQPAAPAPGAAAPAAAADPALGDRPAAPAVEGPAGSASRSRDTSGREVLSVDFPDTDIRDILRNVADLFELNIIMPEALQGRTTIKLRDVTWHQIFQSVLQPVGFTYVMDGNIIKIVSNESLAQEPTETNVFLINYARANDILPTITTLVDTAAGGRIVVDSRSNSLVITERPSRMNRIRPIIEALDRATDQVMIEAKFVEVTDSDVKNIGVNWSSLANYQINAGNLGQNVSRNRGQTSSNGFDQNNNNTRNTTVGSNNGTNNSTTNTQTSGSNNTGSVTSTNGTPSSTSTTGTTGSLNSTTTSGTTASTTNDTTDIASNTLNNLLSLVNNGSTTRDMTAVFSANDFSLVLSALQTLQNTKVVSNPTVVTLNNNEAIINVGEERPIPNYTYSQERGTYEVSGFTWKQLGIILKVTPQVNSQGTIKLTLVPEVSQSTRDANFQGASIPIVETRKASTVVSLKDGYTMGIGGLLRSSDRDTNNKVPVLGNIPVLGRLFSHRGRNNETTNLIIFITAKTISAEGAPLEQVFESERARQLRMRREDMPGHRDGSSPYITVPAVTTEGKAATGR